MIKILLDATIIVALITLLGVIISSVLAPLILERLKLDDTDKEND